MFITFISEIILHLSIQWFILLMTLEILQGGGEGGISIIFITTLSSLKKFQSLQKVSST